MHIQKHCKTTFQFEFNIGTLENVQILSFKLYINSYACRITEPTFGAKLATSEKFEFDI